MIDTGAAVTVVGGDSAENTIVPPLTPGPVPSDPAISVRPTGRPRLCAGIVVPRVSVTAASIITSWPAHKAMLPSVVVIAWNTCTLRPALSRMLPLVAVIGALMLTSRNAFIVSVVGTPEAVHATASLTKMSPLPVVVSPAAGIVLIVMLVVTSCADSVEPEMLPPAPIT